MLIGVFSYYPAVRSLIGGFYQGTASPSADDLADLNTLVDRIGVAGDRCHPAGMKMVNL